MSERDIVPLKTCQGRSSCRRENAVDIVLRGRGDDRPTKGRTNGQAMVACVSEDPNASARLAVGKQRSEYTCAQE